MNKPNNLFVNFPHTRATEVLKEILDRVGIEEVEQFILQYEDDKLALNPNWPESEPE
jgi:hypothetical protein